MTKKQWWIFWGLAIGMLICMAGLLYVDGPVLRKLFALLTSVFAVLLTCTTCWVKLAEFSREKRKT